MIGEIFGAPLGIATGNQAAAMTQAQLTEWQVSLAPATTSPDLYQMLANYRPTVTVPQGIADWYAAGDELH